MQNQEIRIFPIPNAVSEYTMRNTRYVTVDVASKKKDMPTVDQNAVKSNG